ncbi:MAG: glycosyltransferase, partial [Chitinophagaceae bacterium]
MSEKVLTDLRLFEANKPARFVQHPLYDNFGDRIRKQEARRKLGLMETQKIILFFGFIRAYKGLDLLLEAMATTRIREEKIVLLVAGEFYEDARRYLALIDTLGIQSRVMLKTIFIPDSEVKFYLCAADAVIQPYRSAT